MRVPRPLIVGFLALTTVGCGGGSGSNAGKAAGKDPERILADMAAELNKVHSYHVEGTQTDADGTTRVSGDVTAEGSVRFRLGLGSQRIQLVVAGGGAYMKATAGFWIDKGGLPGALARRLGSRWVKVPGNAGLAASMEQLAPANIGYCATRGHGKLTNRGTRGFAGMSVVVLADDGDQAGDAPGELYVAATGRRLPVRAVQTGPKRPGKSDPRCADEAGSTLTASDLHFSDYDKPVAISPPAGALDPASLAASGGAA